VLTVASAAPNPLTIIGIFGIIARENAGGNAQRSLITISNLEVPGGNTVYLSWGQEAAANKGFPLMPQQTYIESIDSGYKPSNLAINGYSAAAVNLAIQERTQLLKD